MCKIDMHVHTEYSVDGVVKLEQIEDLCKQKGLNGVAVIDHNTVQGAIRLKKIVSDNFILIIGEEIQTRDGEITGFFLTENIPPGLTAEETIAGIKSQRGIVSITHPFCRLRRSKIKQQVLERILPEVDIIEVFNSRNIFAEDDKQAFDLAKRYKKAMVVGSDGHLACEYGNSYIKINPFDNTQGFLNSLSAAEFVTTRSPLWVHLATKVAKRIIRR